MSFKFHIFAAFALGCAGGLAAAVPASAQGGAAPDAQVTAGPAETADPQAAALLSLASRDRALEAWYQSRQGAPAWDVTGGALPASALLERLEQAAGHALPQAAYDAPGLRALAAAASEGDPQALARLELSLSQALVRYAGDMSAGALVPSKVDKEIHVFPERPQVATLMTSAVSSPDLGRWLDALAPRDAGYEKLRVLYARLQKEAQAGGWRATLSEGGTLRLDDQGPRVTQLRARLAELGEPAPQTPRPELFDAGLEQAVKSFQTRHGLNSDGLAGRRTFQALGADVGFRMRQVAVNLERMRWAATDLGRKFILVNQADYTMRLYDDGQLTHQARVVVGQRRHRTPEFIDKMDHLVVNPSWNVPRSITMNEILPALKEDPTYLQRKNMNLIATDGGPVPVDTAAHDWSQYGGGYFPYRVKQSPGDFNSLGRVKFMFPNQFAIYLHDTPSKNLFARDARAFSHGCVRVENPFELAYILLAPQYDDPRAAFQALLDSGKERWVHLDEPVTVNLTYRTAWVDENGDAQFRADIYGRDESVWAALEAEGLAPAW